jgi:hypothetical protein
VTVTRLQPKGKISPAAEKMVAAVDLVTPCRIVVEIICSMAP